MLIYMLTKNEIQAVGYILGYLRLPTRSRSDYLWQKFNTNNKTSTRPVNAMNRTPSPSQFREQYNAGGPSWGKTSITFTFEWDAQPAPQPPRCTILHQYNISKGIKSTVNKKWRACADYKLGIEQVLTCIQCCLPCDKEKTTCWKNKCDHGVSMLWSFIEDNREGGSSSLRTGSGMIWLHYSEPALLGLIVAWDDLWYLYQGPIQLVSMVVATPSFALVAKMKCLAKFYNFGSSNESATKFVIFLYV